MKKPKITCQMRSSHEAASSCNSKRELATQIVLSRFLSMDRTLSGAKTLARATFESLINGQLLPSNAMNHFFLHKRVLDCHFRYCVSFRMWTIPLLLRSKMQLLILGEFLSDPHIPRAHLMCNQF